MAASLPAFATPEIIVRFAQSGTAHGLHLDCKTALGLCPESQIALSAERIPGSLLAPLSAAGSPDKSGGTVAVVAGLIAAVKLARVESIELQNRSPRVRSAISDSITLARMVIEASKTKRTGSRPGDRRGDSSNRSIATD